MVSTDGRKEGAESLCALMLDQGALAYADEPTNELYAALPDDDRVDWKTRGERGI